MPRLYLDPAELGGSLPPLDTPFDLPEGNARHVQVLRMQPGDSLTLFDGSPHEYAATILEMGKRHVKVVITASSVAGGESPLHLTLVQALSATERMDYTVQKATELGVQRIQIVQSALCGYKLAEDRLDKRMAHWRGVAIAAAEQCGRTQIPEILPPVKFAQWIARGEQADVRLLLSPIDGKRLDSLPASAASAITLIGPEGGFSDEEERLAISAGYSPLLLGPRIFRTETVAPVIAALLQARFGDF
ncbi:16S rRNA (uracil(1498)-N(3))-methyltransferase [Burkholderiaceae bacterium DAT-1]|nr:16S rRNA (uracil(1498)-N(3))-methyltransferase [Burkholderiaceae bacterium DAT-1]